MQPRRWLPAMTLALAAPGLLHAQSPDLSIQVPGLIYSLGDLVRSCDKILVLEASQVTPEKTSISFRKVRALLGSGNVKRIDHLESNLLERISPGQKVVWFHLRSKYAVMCTGTYWFYTLVPDGVDDGVLRAVDCVDHFDMAYLGPIDHLERSIGSILAGKEVVITARALWRHDAWDRLPRPIAQGWLYEDSKPVWCIRAGLRIRQVCLSADALSSSTGEQVVPKNCRPCSAT